MNSPMQGRNGILLATKGEETEREKKLNQRFTAQDKEEEDGGKETLEVRKEKEHCESTSTDSIKEGEEEGVNINYYVGTAMIWQDRKESVNKMRLIRKEINELL